MDRNPGRTAVSSEEDRILRFWMPILLRTILTLAMLVLAAGLVLTVTSSRHYFVERYHEVQRGHLVGSEKFPNFGRNILAGKPHAVLTLGLFVLTLVPLLRVAFCFLFFIKERDFTYVALTAYVLAGLVLGILLGRVG
jgi:uncharacterized membrane protein